VDKKTQEIMEGVFMEVKGIFIFNKKRSKEEDKSDPIKNAGKEEKKYKPLAET